MIIIVSKVSALIV